MSQEPLKFPSYISESAKAQTLQGEVDKMPEKGALVLADHPGLGYYSCLFLVQVLNGYITLTRFKMVMISLVLCQSGRGLYVLD